MNKTIKEIIIEDTIDVAVNQIEEIMYYRSCQPNSDTRKQLVKILNSMIHTYEIETIKPGDE